MTEPKPAPADYDFLKTPGPGDKKRLSYYWPFLVSLAVLGLDQWSKRWAESYFVTPTTQTGQEISLLGGQFRIIYIINKGASFGFLNGQGFSWVFSLLALAASVALVGWYVWRGTKVVWLQLGLGLILGGIIGNLLDRLFHDGGVTDILNFPNFSLFRVFNVADSGITVGVTILIVTVLVLSWRGQGSGIRGQRPEASEQPSAETSEQPTTTDDDLIENRLSPNGEKSKIEN